MVICGGKLIICYLFKFGNKLIMYLLIGLGDCMMMCGYLMVVVSGDEKLDYLYYCLFWFMYGDVNGISFWYEGENMGCIMYCEVLVIGVGVLVCIKMVNDWIGFDGVKICEDICDY